MRRIVGGMIALMLVEIGWLPGAARAADAGAPTSTTPAVKGADPAAAAYARARSQRVRRQEAEARLRETLANPPEGAPPWMKRAAAAKNQKAAQTEAP
jgi:hypothetical protein